MITRRFLLSSGTAALATAFAIPAWVAAARAAETFEVTHTDAEWRKLLTPDQYAVLRDEGTERAVHQPACSRNTARARSPAPAATSICSPPTTKFDSGTGWPSFWAPLTHAVGTTRRRHVSAWCAPRSIAAAAAAISAMSSTTARRRPACATA